MSISESNISGVSESSVMRFSETSLAEKKSNKKSIQNRMSLLNNHDTMRKKKEMKDENNYGRKANIGYWFMIFGFAFLVSMITIENYMLSL